MHASIDLNEIVQYHYSRLGGPTNTDGEIRDRTHEQGTDAGMVSCLSNREVRRKLAILMLIALAGSVVRLWFGLRAELWAAAPDQLAWGVLLAEGTEGPLRWDQLVHYPHEGGTLVCSLMAISFWKTALGVPALSWVALILESMVRVGMILIAWRSLGFRTAILFAVWSVFAVPSLLPWAMVNFGLHSLAGFWPFAALWIISRGSSSGREAVGLGLVTGLGLSFSYDALMLVVPSCAAALLSHRGWKGVRACVIYLLVTLAVVSPHLATRVWFDTGFELAGDNPSAVRGLEFAVPSLGELVTNTRQTVTRSLPGASLLPELGPFSAGATRLVWGIVLGLGLLTVAWNPQNRRVLLYGLVVGCTWVVLYAASPVFFGERTAAGFVAYRHFGAILPLLVLLAMNSAANGPRLAKAACLLLVLAGVWGGALSIVKATPPESPDLRAAGWILGSKLGHDPARLEALLAHVEESERRELAFGYGWGIAAAVLAPASPPAAEELGQVNDLVSVFSPVVRPRVVQGVRFAFSDGVTPRISWKPPSTWLQDDAGD